MAPENTFASARAALALGGDIIELDVRQSRDEVLYVLHDETLDRTTSGKGPITGQDSTFLDTLDAGEWFDEKFTRESLPRLNDFIEEFKDRAGFYIEVKAADVTKVADTVRRHGVEDRCFTYSENPQTRTDLRVLAPSLTQMMNWRNVNNLSQIVADKAKIVEFHAPDFTPQRLQQARDLGLDVMVHTPLRDAMMFEAALRANVDYLNVDYPGDVAAMREKLQ